LVTQVQGNYKQHLEKWRGLYRNAPLFGVDVPVPSIQPAAVFEDAGMIGVKAWYITMQNN